MHDQQIPKSAKQLERQFQGKVVQLPPKKVRSILSKLCVELGFCLDPKLNARLIHSPPKSPRRFAEVVMKADGVSPLNTELYKKVFLRVCEVFLTELPNDPH